MTPTDTSPNLSTYNALHGANGDPKGPRRHGPAHWVALVRSAIYSGTATAYFVVMTLLCMWVAFFPGDKTQVLLTWWAAGDIFLLRLICGQSVKIRGRENIPQGAALVAAKHQSAWETMALIPMLPKPVVILKKELLKIPIYGWYARHFGMISVDRAGGSAALKALATDARSALDAGAQIVIFPEGTRRALGAPPDYKPGAIFLYDRLKVPMVPVALNSGVFWPRHRFVRYPGTITVSFLPAIAPGLKRANVRQRLEHAIERETDLLVAAAMPSVR